MGDGSLDDLKEDVKNDGDYFTYVYVAKTSNDGKTADLIFIEQWEKKPTVYSHCELQRRDRHYPDCDR